MTLGCQGSEVGGRTRTGLDSSLSNKPPIAARPWGPGEQAAWQWSGQAASTTEPLSWLLLRWRVDPVLFWVEALRSIPLPYQAQILLDLADAPSDVYAFYGLDAGRAKRQVLAPSGHGLGKTRLEAVAIWWHQLTHKFSKRLCTAPTLEQLSGQLWGEVRKMARRLKSHWPELAAEWEILGSSIVHKDPDFGDWVTIARTARAEKPEGLQGAHALDSDDEFGDIATLFAARDTGAPSGGILVIVDEASGVEDEVREVLEGALSEEGARLLACGNPTRPDGWFAEGLEHTTRYAVHPLDCRLSDRTQVYSIRYRVPAFVSRLGHNLGRLRPGETVDLRQRGFVRPEYWLDVLRDCDGDEDHDRFRVRVRGVKPRSATEQCIRTHWVERAQERAEHEDSQSAPVILGLDFGLSSDKHGIAVRQGWNVREAEEWLPPDTPDAITMHAYRRAIDAQGQWHARYIVGDANGVGRGAMERLHEHFNDPARKGLGVQVILFNSGERALDDKRYYRRRDEMWFRYGRPFFSDARCSVPKVPGLARQLTVVGYSEDATRRIRVETKDDVKARTGQPSGNMADALLQTLLVHVPVEEKRAEAPPAHPKIFEDHFRRWRARQEAAIWA